MKQNLNARQNLGYGKMGWNIDCGKRKCTEEGRLMRVVGCFISEVKKKKKMNKVKSLRNLGHGSYFSR